VYRVRVRMPEPAVEAYGERRVVQPGMILAADVITDRRSFLNCLLDPLLAARARQAGA
jgi:membrane fusion protein